MNAPRKPRRRAQEERPASEARSRAAREEETQSTEGAAANGTDATSAPPKPRRKAATEKSTKGTAKKAATKTGAKKKAASKKATPKKPTAKKAGTEEPAATKRGTSKGKTPKAGTSKKTRSTKAEAPTKAAAEEPRPNAATSVPPPAAERAEDAAADAAGTAEAATPARERAEPPSRSVLTTPPEPHPGPETVEREAILVQFEQRPQLEPPPGFEPLERRPAGGPRRLAFVLHMHLPWVLGHGTWPHGEDWLAEAIAHCYLPLLDAFRRLADRGRRHLATVSVTPVVGAMLADPRTPGIVDRYLAERSEAAWDARRSHPLALWWRSEFERLQALWEGFDKNLARALADLSDRQAVELSTSAGTHVYLPLAHTVKLGRLALRTGREFHRELFGIDSRGCWMPECAYRPGGPWRHPVTGISEENRVGNEELLAEQGLAWTVLDSHLLRAGDPAFPYGSDLAPEDVVEPSGPHPNPYWIRQSPVAAFLRDARSAAQVWSRQGGIRATAPSSTSTSGTGRRVCASGG